MLAGVNLVRTATYQEMLRCSEIYVNSIPMLSNHNSSCCSSFMRVANRVVG
jgi:hypothetical protein